MNALLNIIVLFLVRLVIPIMLIMLIGEKVNKQQSNRSLSV